MERLIFPAKLIRAAVIERHVRAARFPGVIVFSCGHAANALREIGLDVLEIGPNGRLRAESWFTPADIHNIWPNLFDATSGHLPVPLMVQLAAAFRGYVGPLLGSAYEIPTGSGETIVCLRWAYPHIQFTPVFNVGPGTDYNEHAPLMPVVGAGWLAADGDAAHARTRVNYAPVNGDPVWFSSGAERNR